MRSVWKFPFFDKHVFRAVCKFEIEGESFILRSRRSFFFFEFELENLLTVYNGKIGVKFSYPIFIDYFQFFQFGQFSYTKSRSDKIHKFNAIYVKNMKKKKNIFT